MAKRVNRISLFQSRILERAQKIWAAVRSKLQTLDVEVSLNQAQVRRKRRKREAVPAE
jgi:hypothetical protein